MFTEFYYHVIQHIRSSSESVYANSSCVKYPLAEYDIDRLMNSGSNPDFSFLATYVFNTTSSSVARITPALSATSPILNCTLNCTFTLPTFIRHRWAPFELRNVTVATLVEVINNRTNTTTTITKYVESLLVNGTAPSNTVRTNAAGTVTAVVTGYDELTTTM